MGYNETIRAAKQGGRGRETRRHEPQNNTNRREEEPQVEQLEFQILYFLQELHTPLLDGLMTAVTFLGTGGWFWIGTGLLLLAFPRTRLTGICVLASLALGFLAGNVCLKNLAARARPCWLDTAVPMLVPVPKDYSFPSGHSLIGFAGAVSIWRMHPGKGIWFLALAGLIAFSRLYLFVHFPTDVLAGAAIGTALGYLVTALAGKAAKYKGKGGDAI